MSTSQTDSMDDHPHTPRTHTLSISELMRSLHTQSPSTVTDGTTIGECFLDILCTKYSGMSAGMTIYEDSLHTNIIGEFSLKEFLKENQVPSCERHMQRSRKLIGFIIVPCTPPQRSIRGGYQ